MDKRTLQLLVTLGRKSVKRTRSYTQAELRERWINYWSTVERKRRQWIRWEIVGAYCPKPFPALLQGLTCGAKKRDGAPCESQEISKSNGRCRVHGGLSTGPRTPEGKAKSSVNGGLVKMWASLRADP